MAEFCRKCYIEICGGSEDDPLVMSDELDLCEGCGEWKQVVVRVGYPSVFARIRQLFGEARRSQKGRSDD